MNTSSSKKKIVIFASGSGSNAENITKYLRGKNSDAEVVEILTNNPNAYVIERSSKLNIPCTVFDRESFKEGGVLEHLKEIKPDLIVLAGFLWLIPKSFVETFPDQIVNVHPALLPKFGGKGMYGHHVHQAVVEAGETETGITIHYVNEKYDDGSIIFQDSVNLNPNDDADTVAQKIHILEYEHFPKVIEKILFDNL